MFSLLTILSFFSGHELQFIIAGTCTTIRKQIQEGSGIIAGNSPKIFNLFIKTTHTNSLQDGRAALKTFVKDIQSNSYNLIVLRISDIAKKLTEDGCLKNCLSWAKKNMLKRNPSFFAAFHLTETERYHLRFRRHDLEEDEDYFVALAI